MFPHEVPFFILFLIPPFFRLLCFLPHDLPLPTARNTPCCFRKPTRGSFSPPLLEWPPLWSFPLSKVLPPPPSGVRRSASSASPGAMSYSATFFFFFRELVQMVLPTFLFYLTPLNLRPERHRGTEECRFFWTLKPRHFFPNSPANKDHVGFLPSQGILSFSSRTFLCSGRSSLLIFRPFFSTLKWFLGRERVTPRVEDPSLSPKALSCLFLRLFPNFWSRIRSPGL